MTWPKILSNGLYIAITRVDLPKFFLSQTFFLEMGKHVFDHQMVHIFKVEKTLQNQASNSFYNVTEPRELS